MTGQSNPSTSQSPTAGKGYSSRSREPQRLPDGAALARLVYAAVQPNMRKLLRLQNSEGEIYKPLWPNPENNRQSDLIYPAVRTAIRECCEGLSPWPIYLHGETGAGKSYAGMLLCDWAGRGIYTTLPELCALLIEAQNERLHDHLGYRRTQSALWKEWTYANIAVLDEIGVRSNVSDFARETIWRAMETRMRERLPLMVISNLELAEIDQLYDARIASRLAEGTVIHTTGDRRVKQ